MKKYDFYAELLKRFNKTSIKRDECTVFAIIIEIIGKDVINHTINMYYEDTDNYDEMFFRVHKSMRQTDFSNKELIEPIKMSNKDWGVTKDMIIKETREIKRKKVREIAANSNEEVLQSVGYFSLYKKTMHSSGLLDSLFWNMIHVSDMFDYHLQKVVDDIKNGNVKPIKEVVVDDTIV